MKKFTVPVLPVLLLAFCIVFASCSDPSGSGGNQPSKPPVIVEPAANLISGTFNGMTFIANKDTARSITGRAITSDSSSALTGLVQNGDKVYSISGFYDDDTGNFSLSGATDDAGFNLNGVKNPDGDFTGTGYDREKDSGSGDWNENSENIVFAEKNINGNSNQARKQGIPQSLWGKWDAGSNSINAQATEYWGIGWDDTPGYEGMYCLLIMEFGFSTWMDVPLAMQLEKSVHLKYNPDQSEQEVMSVVKPQVETYISNLQYFNILAVVTQGSATYVYMSKFSLYEGFKYMKVKFEVTSEGLKATIGNNSGYLFSDMDGLRANEDDMIFVDDPLDPSSNENYATLYMKRF